MATENQDENQSARRLRLRRSVRGGGGFAGGGSSLSTRSESLRSSDAEEDEVDAAIDPEDVRQHVQTRASVPAPQQPPGQPDPDNPRQRMMDVARSGSTAYAKEYRLSLLHRLLLRNIPLDQIARQLGVSISTVEKDRAALKKRLRETARQLDVDEMIGAQTGLYEEITGMSLRIAGRATGEGAVPVPMQLAAMRTALAANADKTRFYHSAGVFDVLRYRRAEDGSAISDIGMLMERTSRMLAALGADDEGFTFADNPDPEIMDL